MKNNVKYDGRKNDNYNQLEYQIDCLLKANRIRLNIIYYGNDKDNNRDHNEMK
jgi:hypothetical protein